MPTTLFVPADLLVVVACGCRRILSADPSKEVRCAMHEARGGWKCFGDPVICYENEVHAIETYKGGRFDQACYTIDCLNRRVPGASDYGFCEECGAREKARISSPVIDDPFDDEAPF